MKRPTLAILALCSLSCASARADSYLFDLNHRPPGVTDAEVEPGVQAATKVCDPANLHPYASKRFLACMHRQGYTFVRIQREASADPAPKLARGHFIDKTNGMDCQTLGGAEVCDPPKGTVHYFDPDQGLPCTRTGVVSVCSNM